MHVRVDEAAFDAGAELNRFQAGVSGAGAVVSFSGIVRDNSEGTLSVMEIEHYPGMTEAALTAYAAEAKGRWDLRDVLVIHRYGSLKPGEPIMMVATAAAHRKAAFEAADYLMDYLKSRAPFWKKEVTHDGADWVQAKEEDEAALAQWSKGSD